MKKNKGARMQKSRRNEAEKIMRSLSQVPLPQSGNPNLRTVLRHGDTITFEEVK